MWWSPSSLVILLFGLAQGRIIGKVQVAEYTTNSVCIQKNCINPIFPAIHKLGHSVLDRNQNRTWRCVSKRAAWKDTSFCSRVVSSYQFALPVPIDGTEVSEEELSRQQAKEAVEAYVAHVAGLGRDFWVLTEPWKHDECIQMVWRMACLTHFPRCNQLSPGQYLRPCASTCQSYVRQCQVSCCDEGVQCVFTHHRQFSDGQVVVENGYVSHAGPSLLCTGAATFVAHPSSAITALVATISTIFAFQPRWLHI